MRWSVILTNRNILQYRNFKCGAVSARVRRMGMKRIICSILVACLLLTVAPFHAYAAELSDREEEIIYFEDGSYITISVRVNPSRAAGSVSGDKVYTYYYDGGTAWKAVLTGSFTYTGSSATCTSSSCDVTVYNSAWYTVSKSASRSGNSATASVTMGRKLLGITVEKIPTSLKLTCDANGNLS